VLYRDVQCSIGVYRAVMGMYRSVYSSVHFMLLHVASP